MTDQTVPADKVREIIEKMRDHADHNNVRGSEEEYVKFFASQLEDLLPTPPLPTLADMTPEERAACRWMQADAGPYGRRGLIVKVKYWSVYVVDKETGTYSDYTPDLVTARPDLPSMEWNGTDQKIEDMAPVKVGDVIESADDPRLGALPAGSVLLDRDNDAVTKEGERWAGLGYEPVPDEGDDVGPWKVINIGQEEDQ